MTSLTAYFFGEFANSFVLSKLKYKQNGKRGISQASRFVWSTIVGEGLDSLLFMTVGFLGIMATDELFKIVLTIWGIKVLYEIIALPVSMSIANWVKKIDGFDVIDDPRTTNYSPFSTR
ncbi:hypothetical protein MELA_02002 [Candidatus Methylomirabilis lanthanidiphila]|uniref:Uncharacterized protein n=1 Tax=Candidatus Methylomirabilis lanthanidiphila TaxID=2211376 RepID=A0A564ZL74_9BACT|nr:VUT family protein [Candidatus Methylomirabilis lanthanidiphila]VUZ85617.1 hypothetical protein MELA_02002 [Candidatus Methylomirabilis lanthanidiphila]